MNINAALWDMYLTGKLWQRLWVRVSNLDTAK
jgi:hypothetical protein